MESMGFKNQGKRKRRGTQRRKLPSVSPMDMAEARREIVNALHLHRSSSSMPSCDTRQENTDMASSAASTITSSSSQLYYPLVESIQFPEPTWSTTEPAAAAAAALLSAPPPLDHVLEFEWPENNLSSSSYSWWFGFLRSLDGGNDGADQLSEYCYSCQENVSAGSKMNMVALDQNEQSLSSEAYDQWLTITAAEDHEAQPL